MNAAERTQSRSLKNSNTNIYLLPDVDERFGAATNPRRRRMSSGWSGSVPHLWDPQTMRGIDVVSDVV